MTALSLAVKRRQQRVLWRHPGLPSSCHAAVPVPGRPAALLLAQSHVMYVSQQVGGG